MVSAWLRENWALVGAAGLITGLSCMALYALARSSARAQLWRARKVLRRKRKALRRASGFVKATERNLQRLQQRADRVKPRHLEDVRETLADATALSRIALDQVLIAENQLRRIIVQEFAPAKQARLRARYRLSDAPGEKPFTF